MIRAQNSEASANEIPVGKSPTSVAFTPDGRVAYVAMRGCVGVIDPMTRKVTSTIALPPTPLNSSLPSALAMSPNGRYLIVVGLIGGGVRVIDTFTNTLTPITIEGNVPLSTHPEAVAISPDGLVGFFQDAVASLRVIDIPADLPAGNWVLSENSPTWILSDIPSSRAAITPDGRRLFVTNESCFAAVLDSSIRGIPDGTSSMAKAANLANIVVSCDAAGVCVSPDGNRAFVANFRGSVDESVSTISVIDAVTMKGVGREVELDFPEGVRATGIAITPDGRDLYLPTTGPDDVDTIAIVPTSVILGAVE